MILNLSEVLHLEILSSGAIGGGELTVTFPQPYSVGKLILLGGGIWPLHWMMCQQPYSDQVISNGFGSGGREVDRSANVVTLHQLSPPKKRTNLSSAWKGGGVKCNDCGAETGVGKKLYSDLGAGSANVTGLLGGPSTLLGDGGGGSERYAVTPHRLQDECRFVRGARNVMWRSPCERHVVAQTRTHTLSVEARR